MKNFKFDTVYKYAKAWAKSKKLNMLGFYRSFRNETNRNFNLRIDNVNDKINHPECVYLKQINRMTIKEMCRLYFKMRLQNALNHTH